MTGLEEASHCNRIRKCKRRATLLVQRGLATVVCASLLVHCLERGIQAHWGAANPQSAALAEKLGFSPIDHQKVLLLIE